jgi:hypothetical protein
MYHSLRILIAFFLNLLTLGYRGHQELRTRFWMIVNLITVLPK